MKRWRAVSIGLATLLTTSRGLAQPAEEIPPPAAPAPAPAPPPIEALPIAPGPAPPSLEGAPPEPPPFDLPPPRGASGNVDPNSTTSDWQLYLTGSGEVTTFSYPGTQPGATSFSGASEVSLGRYFTPVIDDDAPRSLQPYLQRTSIANVSFSLSGFSTTTGNSFIGTKRTNLNFGPEVGMNVYVVDAFAITASFLYSYDALNDSIDGSDKTHAFVPQAGFAIRGGDTRVDLYYRFEADDVDGQFTSPLWGTLTLNVETVIDRRIDLSFQGQVYDGGAGGSASVEVYPTKNLGIFANGFGFAGRTYTDGVKHNDYGGNVGTGFWVAPRVELLFEYQLAGTTEPLRLIGTETYGYSELKNGLYGRLLFRLP